MSEGGGIRTIESVPQPPIDELSELVGGGAPEVDTRLIPLHRWFMALFLLLFNVADVLITKAILGHGGIEQNPVMKPIMDDRAMPLVVKTLVALFVGALLLRAPVPSKLADRAMGLVLVTYVLVLGWNFGVLLQALQLHPVR